MPEKLLTDAELDAYGLEAIDLAWANRRKLEHLFAILDARGDPLPSIVNSQTEQREPNKSELARLAKVRAGRQVFKGKWASKALNDAVQRRGLASPQDREDDEVHEQYEEQAEENRKARSKLQTRLDIVTAERDEARDQLERERQASRALREELQLAKGAQRRVEHHELHSLRRIPQ